MITAFLNMIVSLMMTIAAAGIMFIGIGVIAKIIVEIAWWEPKNDGG